MRRVWRGAVVAIEIFAMFLGAGYPAALGEVPLEISLTTDCSEIMASETASVRVRLTGDGVGVPGARLTLASSASGTFQVPLDLGNGDYIFSWTAPKVTTQTYVGILVRASAEGFADSFGRIVFLVDPNQTATLNPTQIFLLAQGSATVLRPGETALIRVWAFTIEGFLIHGATGAVRVVYSSYGTVTAVREVGCDYRFTFTASATITADTAVRVDVTFNKLGFSVGTIRLGLLIVP